MSTIHPAASGVRLAGGLDLATSQLIQRAEAIERGERADRCALHHVRGDLFAVAPLVSRPTAGYGLALACDAASDRGAKISPDDL